MSEPSEAVGPDGPSPCGPCLDRSMVDGMREALQDDSLVVELAGSFLRDTPQRLQALAAALLDDDLVHVAKIAHYVKGSAQMFGATRLADVCAAVEYDRAVAELRAHLAELG